MASTDDIKKLAALARIDIPEAELPGFARQIDDILAYVGQLESLNVTPSTEAPPVRNVFREDGEPHSSGANTEKITAAFPERKDDALKVKQIISHD